MIRSLFVASEAVLLLGAAMVTIEHSNAAFRADFAAAKADLARAPGPAPVG